MRLLFQKARPLVPCPHDGDHRGADQDRHVAAIKQLHEVGGEEREFDGEEHRDEHRRAPHRPAPQLPHDEEQQQRIHHHGRGDRNSVGRGEVRRRAEHQHQKDHPEEEDAVHAGDEDLAFLRIGGVLDLEARQQAQLDRLAGEGECAGDRRLTGDDCGHRGEQHQRQQSPIRSEQEEGILHRFPVSEDQRALAQIVENQRGEDERDPRHLNRLAAEMAHVCVKRLRPCHRKENGAQHDEADDAVREQEGQRVVRVERIQDAHLVADVQKPEDGEHKEPYEHDRPEPSGHARRAVPLHHEQGAQDHDRNRDHVRLEQGCDELQALHRRQHRDGRRNHGVAGEQRGADDAQQEDERASSPEGFLRQRHQRQRSAFAAVVGLKHEDDVLHRHDDEDRPDQQRDDADHLCVAHARAAGVGERFAQRVKGARADVAAHHAHRREGEGEGAGLAVGRTVVVSAVCRVGRLRGCIREHGRA